MFEVEDGKFCVNTVDTLTDGVRGISADEVRMAGELADRTADTEAILKVVRNS
ncbi:hypothetical protein [Streptomyces atratus]|uniref:hypothetical protein n=1 Tax=Streptomyces atratus TaxID=1893 RepID=UPI00379E8388